MNKTKNLHWRKFIRFLLLAVLGLVAILGYSLLNTLDQSVKFTLFIGFGSLIVFVLLIDLFTKQHILTMADVKDLFPVKKRK